MEGHSDPDLDGGTALGILRGCPRSRPIGPRFSTSIEFHGVCLGSGSFKRCLPSPVRSTLRLVPRIRLCTTPTTRTLIRGLLSLGLRASSTERLSFERVLAFTTARPRMTILNAGLESDTFRVRSTSQRLPLLARPIEQTVPDLSVAWAATASLQHPRALQREGRRDLYAEEWGLTIEHELPANFLVSAQYLGSPRRAVVFPRRGESLHREAAGDHSTGNDHLSAPAGPVLSRRRSLWFGRLQSDIGSSTYNALTSPWSGVSPTACLSRPATPGPTPSTMGRSAAVSPMGRKM